MDFYSYFLPSNKINLENISYEALESKPISKDEQIKLNCKDTILAKISPGGVKINFNRKVDFEPERIFVVSVTFSVFLPFKEGASMALEWSKIDVAGEFRRAGGPLVSALMSRASLMIGQITAAAGQNPLITAASPIKAPDQKGDN
ncbi:MAG: hypothetical protein IKL36_02075 [Clostridia bacterium]|nr:hypothetical protein [Clostridia bacterium]